MSRRRTIEWQVCGVCNYDCSYCIQSRASRVGHPSDDEVESFLRFFAALPGHWEVKMTGGEPFAFKGFLDRIVPGLIEETPHTVSVLTNLSAPLPVLARFARLTRGRLGIVSASVHREFVDPVAFADKAAAFRLLLDDQASLVVNNVIVPGEVEAGLATRTAIESAGLRFFPQLMKVKGGVAPYPDAERGALLALTGRSPTPRQANVAPSYRGRTCWTGVDYFVLTQTGDAWSCRSAKRVGEGHLGNVHDGSFALRAAPLPCAYDICPCTVPANRGMIEGVGAAASRHAGADAGAEHPS